MRDIFSCSCGAQYSWSKGVDVREALIHISVACISTLPDPSGSCKHKTGFRLSPDSPYKRGRQHESNHKRQ